MSFVTFLEKFFLAPISIYVQRPRPFEKFFQGKIFHICPFSGKVGISLCHTPTSLMSFDTTTVLAFLNTTIATIAGLYQAVKDLEKAFSWGRIPMHTIEQQMLELEKRFEAERGKYKELNDKIPRDSPIKEDPCVNQAINTLTLTCSSFNTTSTTLKKRIFDAKTAEGFSNKYLQQTSQSSHLTSSPLTQSINEKLPYSLPPYNFVHHSLFSSSRSRL